MRNTVCFGGFCLGGIFGGFVGVPCFLCGVSWSWVFAWVLVAFTAFERTFCAISWVLMGFRSFDDFLLVFRWLSLFWVLLVGFSWVFGFVSGHFHCFLWVYVGLVGFGAFPRVLVDLRGSSSSLVGFRGVAGFSWVFLVFDVAFSGYVDLLWICVAINGLRVFVWCVSGFVWFRGCFS